MKRPLLLLTAAGLCLRLCAQVGPDTSMAAETDSTLVEEDQDEEELPPTTYADWKNVGDDTLVTRERSFDADALSAYREDPALDYDRTVQHGNRWWDGFLDWVGRKLDRLFGHRTSMWMMDKWDWFGLVAAAILLIFIFRRTLFAGVLNRQPYRARQVMEAEEHIGALDLDDLLAKAEQARDWRLAVRYRYLKVLRRLVDEGRIEWQPHYTDHDYLAQLKDPVVRVAFSELSFLFKWVWYGDAPLDERRYNGLRPAFDAFHQRAVPA